MKTLLKNNGISDSADTLHIPGKFKGITQAKTPLHGDSSKKVANETIYDPIATSFANSTQYVELNLVD